MSALISLLKVSKFFIVTPRPRTPRSSYKNALFVGYNGKRMYIWCFYSNIGLSSIKTRNVKKGKHISIQTNEIFISRGTSRSGTLRPSFRTLDFLVHNMYYF